MPHDWTHKIVRKIQASQELYGKLTGYIDTPEKFEAAPHGDGHARMGADEGPESRECRNCHSFTAMEVAKQRPRARSNHTKAQEEGKTCIDCHKGIAHLLPKEYKEDEE